MLTSSQKSAVPARRPSVTAKLPRCRSSAAPCSDLRSDLPLHPHSACRQSLDLYVAFMRGTPLLMVLFICYFALPALLVTRQRLLGGG